MQDHNWHDLTVFLALQRQRTLAGAGLTLAINETTIARRLRRLEDALGQKLFHRTTNGTLELTETGQTLLPHAERIEAEHGKIRDLAGAATGTLQASVRISGVPIVINRILLPQLPILHAQHPGLTVELVPEGRNIDLTKREADIALRMARPSQGGMNIKARKLASVPFAVSAPADRTPEQIAALPWITYDDQTAGLPQARWLESQVASDSASRAPIRVTDAETALAAVACGLGKSLLPRAAITSDPRLCLSDVPGPPLSRPIWQLSHKDQDARAAVQAAKAWLSHLTWV